jgi:hypothetical protein
MLHYSQFSYIKPSFKIMMAFMSLLLLVMQSTPVHWVGSPATHTSCEIEPANVEMMRAAG